MRRASLTLFFAAGAAHAHPGHVDGPLWHLLTEPDHLALILLPAAIAAIAVFVRRRRARAHRKSP